MLIKSIFLRYLSSAISILFLIYIIYLIYTSYFIVKNQFIDIGDETYVNQVSIDDYTIKLSNFLIKDCAKNKLCEVQSILDYVTKIPYKINVSVARSPKNVVEQNFGDCDDKSNLLISLLKVQNYEAYFVLVPQHIFVIVHLNDINLNRKALYINDKRYYILESTATNSKIGFPLKYDLKDIKAVVNPFINKKLYIEKLTYN